jgi:HK97 family phage prohead protease
MKRIRAYAIVYESASEDIGGFKEIIKPAALKGVIARSDCLCLVNHDISQGLLGRCTRGEGTMSLSTDSHGLLFEVQPPSSAAPIVEAIQRKDMRGCSFAFTLQKGGDEFRKLDNGQIIRTITAIDQLYDVSVVARPCYPSTSVEVV